MRRLLPRALLCALCFIFTLTSALGGGVSFRITADIDPVQYADSLRPLMEGLAALCDASALTGTVQAEGDRFDVTAVLSLPHRNGVQESALRVWGIPSHWCIESDLLGGEPLMINHLALAEFGVKAFHHLDVPLQYAALAVPYVHMSAFDVLRPEVSVLFPLEDGVTLLSLAEVQALSARIAALAEDDRTLRYWIEAIGIATGADQAIYDALRTLPDALSVLCPHGLTITRTEHMLTWAPTVADDASAAPLLTLNRDGPVTALTATLPGLGTAVMSLRDDVTILTGTLHTESPLVTGELAFSLPTALPVTMPFFLSISAEGLLLGDAPVSLVLEGEAHGNTLTIRRLLPDQTRTMFTMMVTLSPIDAAPLPEWTAQDIPGVNILSATGTSLTQLLTDVRGDLVPELFRLVAALPARTCQALMDLMEDSGILGLLTESMTGSAEY